MRGGRLFRTGLSAAVMLVAVGLGPWSAGASAPSGDEEGRAGGSAGLIDAVHSTRRFSPNGDGVLDKVKVGIQLARAATVSLTVRRVGSDEVLRQVSLGRVPAGLRVWAWNGRNARGRVVRDGKYAVRVVATSGKGRVRHDEDQTRVALRTVYTPITRDESAPRLELSRSTVYPATQDFDDVLFVRAYQFRKTWDLYGNGQGTAEEPPMKILDATGRRVDTWTTERERWWEPLEWTATSPDGTPLPAGRYTLVVLFTDTFGNTERTERKLEVSGSPLVAQRTWSSTVGAADALTSEALWSADCDGCGPLFCSPSPSVRTAGALTVRSPEVLRRAGRPCSYSEGAFAAAVPFELGMLDRIAVTVGGSWHPAAGPGSGSVYLDSVTGATTAFYVEPPAGAGPVTVGPALHSGHGSTDQVQWFVGGEGLQETEWDLETFDVQVVRYAPAD